MIRNKTESQRFIESKGLNYNPYLVLTGDTTLKEIHDFAKNYEFLAIRDPRPMGKFKHLVPRKRLLDVIAEYPTKTGLKLQPSLKAYDDTCLLLQGDIEINTHTELVRATLNSVPGVSLREATNNPDILQTYTWDWTTGKDPNVRGLSEVIDYLFEHELLNMIVEFTLYSRPVGIKNEPLIIWECRNY